MSLNVLKTNYFLILLTNVASSYEKWKKEKLKLQIISQSKT